MTSFQSLWPTGRPPPVLCARGLELTQHLLEWSGLRRGAAFWIWGAGAGGGVCRQCRLRSCWGGPIRCAAERGKERYPHLTFIRGRHSHPCLQTFDAVLLECVYPLLPPEKFWRSAHG